MRIVITLDVQGVEKHEVAILHDPKPEGPISLAVDIPGAPDSLKVEPTVTEESLRRSLLEIAADTLTEAVTINTDPAPKKRGRPRKTVDIGATEKPLVGQAAPVGQRVLEAVSEAVKEADIPVSPASPESAPVEVTEPVLQAVIKADIPAVQIPLCPVCKEPMNGDERYDAFLCIKDGQFNNTVKPSQIVQAIASIKAAPAVPEVKPTATQAVLTEEEQKSIKARLGKYWVSILPEAGMTADDGKSINAKLTQFANNFADSREWPNSRAWNAKQWDTFLGFMDGVVGSKGAKALVAHINQEIGSK